MQKLPVRDSIGTTPGMAKVLVLSLAGTFFIFKLKMFH